jgi:hypothetical protein
MIIECNEKEVLLVWLPSETPSVRPESGDQTSAIVYHGEEASPRLVVGGGEQPQSSNTFIIFVTVRRIK